MPARRPAPGDLEPIESASRDQLQALQLKRLQWTLRHAYDHVPHYRALFDATGFHPNDLTSLSDLARLPFTTKKDLREHYPFGLFAVPREQVVRIHASSGTTGKPTVVGYTRNDIEVWATVMARSIRAAGGRPGDIVHIAYGYGLFTGGLGAHYGAEKLGCTVIPMSGGMTERQVQLIVDFKPQLIMVTPSYMLAIAEEMQRQGIEPKTCSLKIGIFGAEPWTPTMRQAIEAKLDLDAIDIYGLSEVIGPGVAQECIETKDGLDRMGGSLLSGDHRSGERRSPSRRRAGRARVHLAHQGSVTHHPLSHPRSHPPFAADRARHAADRKDHRPLR